MQEELTRARSLLRCSESVESVIDLLDQTFQRLQSDVASADFTDASTLASGKQNVTVTSSNVTSLKSMTSQTSIQSSSSHFSQEQVKFLLSKGKTYFKLLSRLRH